MILANQVVKNNTGAYAPSTPQGGNWRLWPFSFRRSTSEKVLQPLDANDTKASERPIDRDADKNEVKPKPLKKNVRVTTPTSEQLASLNLKEGKNSVTFTFSTNMLGNQQVSSSAFCLNYTFKYLNLTLYFLLFLFLLLEYFLYDYFFYIMFSLPD